ncbi:glycosyltransferase family 2 protein [Sphaerospermopsis sp. LEGE 00249]|nr:glycosyltransferase family 2 protein [Sphaerospermopsis sp. LEGE 00249]
MIEGMVSTIIPVYNRPQFLLESVNSVLAQTHRPIEIIIVDDGSTDSTPEVGRHLALQYPETICWLQISNSGPGPAREAGKKVARGEFIQYLDSDDRLLPSKFADQIQVLRRHPECGIAYGYTRLIDEHGNELSDPFKWTGQDLPYLFPGLLVDRWWCTHTPLYRRTVTDAIGCWSNLRWSQDWEYDARAGALRTRLINCHTYVSEHRHHTGQRQTSQADWFTDTARLQNRAALLKALWKNAQQAGISPKDKESLHFSRWAFLIARHCGAVGLINECQECLDLAIGSSQGVKFQDLTLYRWLCRLIGQQLASKIMVEIARIKNNPGQATLPQSFVKTDGEN